MGQDNEQNKKFFSEIVKDLKDGDKILIVGFARNSDEYQIIFERDKASILDNAEGKQIEILWANEKDFLKQIEQCSAVLIEGGDTFKLLEVLKKNYDFQKFLDGKIVAGSSAGAYVLSKYFYSNSKDKIFEGLGILPIKILCHYEGNKDAIERINQYHDELELIILKDYEYKIIEK